MRIEVVGTNIAVTDAIREHAESKVDKLLRHFDGVQLVTFRLEREAHGNHASFGIEIIVDVVGRDDFVAKAKGDDLYAAIDQALHKSVRQLTDHKEKLRQSQQRGN